jgi:hypothetical protein
MLRKKVGGISVVPKKTFRHRNVFLTTPIAGRTRPRKADVQSFVRLTFSRRAPVLATGFVFLALMWLGCSHDEPEVIDDYLARAGERVITMHDFNRAFELKKTAYAHSLRQNPKELRDAKLRLLNQMILELMMLQRALEVGITVESGELEATVAEIKSDYPKGEFENTLLEFAVSFDTWKNRLKDRMVIEKLIDRELKERVNLSSEEIADYYRKNYQALGDDGENTSGSEEDINESIIANLRRNKAEKAYDQWVKSLKDRYPVEVNQRMWQKVLEEDLPPEDGEGSENGGTE